MSEVVQLRCPSCGSPHVSYDSVKGAYYCESCNSFFSSSDDVSLKGLFEEASRLRNAMNFEEALERLEQEESKHSDNAEIYFGKILARYGVTYVDDAGHPTPVPTLSRASELSITSSNDYKKCLANASNNVLKTSYSERLDEIEAIRKRVIDASKKQQPYDVFICYKKTDGELRTKDSELARKIYDKLTRGVYGTQYRVFFADETLQNTAGQEYEPIIYNALMTAKVMLVIAASKPEYVVAPWVKNEWARFKSLVDADKKNGQSTRALVPVLSGGFKPHDLPGALSKFQAIENDADFDKVLKATLNQFAKKGISSKIEKGKMVAVEVKPIEIEEKTIERRGFAKAEKVVVLSASEETRINKIYTLLSGSDRDKYKRCIMFADEVLRTNPQNGEAAWLKLLALQKCSSNEAMGNKVCNNLLNNIELIINALENTIESDYKLRFETLSNSLSSTVFNGNFDVAAKFYSFLITVCDEYAAEDLTARLIETLARRINRIKKGGSRKFNINNLIEAFYPVLTKIGVDGMIEAYNLLANAFLQNYSFVHATTYYQKTLDLFAAQPEALWGIMHSKLHVVDDYMFAKVCKNPQVLYENVEQMLKGGYVIYNKASNYYIKARNICFYMLDGSSSKKRAAIIDVYKQLFSLIPDRKEYAELAYQCSVDFADLLTLKKEFKHAETFYREVLVKNPLDTRTHIGLFRCQLKVATNLELLKLRKSFDMTKFGLTPITNILEAEAQNRSSAWDKFSALHDEIKNLPGYARKRLLAAIKNAILVCEFGIFNPDIQYVTKTLNSSLRETITTNKNTENKLAQVLYRDFVCPDEKLNDQAYIEVAVKSICHNTGFGDTVLGLNVKAELLFTLIPTVVCWVLYFGSFIDMDPIIEPMWSSVFPAIAGVGTIILFFITLSEWEFWGALFGSAAIMFGGVAALFGAFTGLGYGLQALADGVFFQTSVFVPVAITLGILPYAIFKLVDILKKRLWINTKYISFTITLSVLVIITPIIVSILVSLA